MRDNTPNYFPEVRYPTTISPLATERERQQRHEATQRAIRERQQRDAQRAAEREKAAQERAASELEAYKEERRRQWIGATGSEAGFEAAWPKMREEFATRGSLRDQIAAEMKASGLYSL